MAQMENDLVGPVGGPIRDDEGADEGMMGVDPIEQEPLPQIPTTGRSVLDSGSWESEDSVVVALERQGGLFNRSKAAVHKAFNYLIRLHGSPEDIAWGLALGLFIAMSPTVGLQMAIAVAAATVLRVNSAAAAAGVWLTNPLTIPVLYGLNYYIGATILGHESTFRVNGELTLETLLEAGSHVWWSLIVGGAITGAVVGLASYYPTLFVVRTGRVALRKRRERRLARRMAKMSAKRAAQDAPGAGS
jgi:hypothetical protein